MTATTNTPFKVRVPTVKSPTESMTMILPREGNNTMNERYVERFRTTSELYGMPKGSQNEGDGCLDPQLITQGWGWEQR